jgi:hypothetical protein
VTIIGIMEILPAWLLAAYAGHYVSPFTARLEVPLLPPNFPSHKQLKITG